MRLLAPAKDSGGLDIYKSRNFMRLLANGDEETEDEIYKSRNFMRLLATYKKYFTHKYLQE